MEISPKILATYYNTAFYMLQRGYTSDDEFKGVARNVLEAMGYPNSAIETIVLEALERVKVIRAFEEAKLKEEL